MSSGEPVSCLHRLRECPRLAEGPSQIGAAEWRLSAQIGTAYRGWEGQTTGAAQPPPGARSARRTASASVSVLGLQRYSVDTVIWWGRASPTEDRLPGFLPKRGGRLRPRRFGSLGLSDLATRAPLRGRGVISRWTVSPWLRLPGLSVHRRKEASSLSDS